MVTNSGTSSVTITGTVAQINNLLTGNATSTVSYIDNTDTPSASSTLTLTAHDNGNTGTGGDLVSVATSTINITAVNDAPVATITPVSYAATEQAGLTLTAPACRSPTWTPARADDGHPGRGLGHAHCHAAPPVRWTNRASST